MDVRFRMFLIIDYILFRDLKHVSTKCDFMMKLFFFVQTKPVNCSNDYSNL